MIFWRGLMSCLGLLFCLCPSKGFVGCWGKGKCANRAGFIPRQKIVQEQVRCRAVRCSPPCAQLSAVIFLLSRHCERVYKVRCCPPPVFAIYELMYCSNSSSVIVSTATLSRSEICLSSFLNCSSLALTDSWFGAII